MKNIHMIAILFFLFVSTSCNNEISFVEIPNNGKSDLSFDEDYNKETSFYFIDILVSNPPEEKDQIIDMLKIYTDSIKAQIDFMESDSDVYNYHINFYRKNRTTSYFIDHDVYDGGIFEATTYLDEQYEDYLIGLRGTRNKKDSTKWDKYYNFYVLSKGGYYNRIQDTIEFHGK